MAMAGGGGGWRGAIVLGRRLGLGLGWEGRMKSSSSAPQLGEGGLQFQARTYPTFWSRLKQEKHGLGSMALSASIAFLAVGIIKQEKELARVSEGADRLREQNEGLRDRLEGVKAVLAKDGVRTTEGGDVVAVLREMLDLNGGGRALDSSDEPEIAAQSTSSKFMI